MRNLGLDLLKIFSCIGVVVLHSTRPGFNLEQYNISAYLYYLATYAIPLFFMLNGYFLLNKKKLPYSYVFNKIRGILTIVFVWNMLIWVIKRDFNVNPLMKIIGSLIQKGYAYQFWFFGSLIIIYLTLPIVKKVLEKDYSYFAILLILIVIGIVIEMINTFIFHKPLQQYVPQTFRLWTWFFYYILGGYLGKINIQEIKLTKLIKISFSIIFIISPILLFYLAKNVYHDAPAEYFYDSMIVKIVSIGLFILFLKIEKNIVLKNNELIVKLSSLTMGVYIVHTYVLARVAKYINYNLWYNTVIILFVTLSISFLISRIIWSVKNFRVLLKI
ncbi:acyltransferase [Streptococcus mitis]|uniref:acyltransferase n=1 Tax=Streptococcus mitis TaxID=28037 RepID=UPI001EE05C25|nr:acyltransferase family protein [Streptococcus mitis]MCG4864484.1 acyltransferase family protein [Streptococcus mitis]